jgi:hypothetical protein
LRKSPSSSSGESEVSVVEKLKIAFDVDDTLVKENHMGREEPNRPLLNVLLWFYAQGHEIIVWSGGGAEYAETWARRLFIDHIVTIKSKPLLAIGKRGEEISESATPVVDIAFDDMEVNYGKVNIRV